MFITQILFWDGEKEFHLQFTFSTQRPPSTLYTYSPLQFESALAPKKICSLPRESVKIEQSTHTMTL